MAGHTVDLERSRTSRAFSEEDESLWGAELKRLFELVGRHQESLENQTSDDPEEQPLLSIAVFGTYGSGKTSMIKTLAKRANGDNLPPGLKRGVFSLPVIEPNLLARDDHFLYAFLATALEEDSARQRRDDESQRRRHIMTPIQQGFQEVSEYLHVIDSSERVQEYDPLGLSLERLERHSSGLLLRQKLLEWITRLADEFAGPKAMLLLPVDDADMSLENLVATLDTYRRYLQHPRLVPVFTFTSRLAEELLRVHFGRKLLVGESQKISEKLSETATSLEMTEHLAYQYLVKLFPIRNRIRLGPAPARIQGAHYYVSGSGKTPEEQKKPKKQRVVKLLKVSSRLLFGRARWPSAFSVRLALRPSTLRRQLQIVDAMNDARVLEVLPLKERVCDPDRRKDTTKEHEDEGDNKEGTKQETRTWAKIFDSAAWSLLNVHRDALREYHIHIEDLYSWTPLTLRRVVLESILMLDLESRRKLVKLWRYSIEDRRSQVLSLLAANAFRPEMAGEELSGDDPDRIQANRGTTGRRTEDRKRPISTMKGVVWWLNLWIGFYLPQVLARNRRDDVSERDPTAGKVRGVGWDLTSGPVNAVREALANNEISSTGMMLLGPAEFAAQIAEPGELSLLIHLWCFYGEDKGRPWSVVSFWRGLGLLGQLLADRETQRFLVEAKLDGKDKKVKTVKKEDKQDRIAAIIRAHCAGARVPGTLGHSKVEFSKWQDDRYKTLIMELAKEVDAWLDAFSLERKPEDESLEVMRKANVKSSSSDKRKMRPTVYLDPEDREPPEEPENPRGRETAWRDCFIRRLHGEYILGEFWRMLEGSYLESPEGDLDRRGHGKASWTAWAALAKWSQVLLKYSLDGGGSQREGGQASGKKAEQDTDLEWQDSVITELLRKCPFVKPFVGKTAAKRPDGEFLGEEVSEVFRLLQRVETREDQAEEA